MNKNNSKLILSFLIVVLTIFLTLYVFTNWNQVITTTIDWPENNFIYLLMLIYLTIVGLLASVVVFEDYIVPFFKTKR